MRARELREYDWILVGVYIALVAIGWAMIYSVGYDYDNPSSIFDLGTSAGKQGLWILVSLVVAVGVMIIDPKFFKSIAYLIYGVAVFLVILVTLTGAVTKGASSWFQIGFMKFQPSEIAKFATCLALATYLSQYNTSLKHFRTIAACLGIIGLPMLLILLEDAGSALVFLGFFVVLFREGLSAWVYILAFLAVTLFILAILLPVPVIAVGVFALASFLVAWNLKQRQLWLLGLGLCFGASIFAFYYKQAWVGVAGIAVFLTTAAAVAYIKLKREQRQLGVAIATIAFLSLGFVFGVNYGFNKVLKPHQQDRINVWLQPQKTDPTGRGKSYNIRQSKIAIGSGGIEGKGFMEGTHTKLRYVPEQNTDFIFCTIGEEQGFIGTFAVIALYLTFLILITNLAERQSARFTRLYAYGVAGIFLVHLLVNVGMTVGLMPIIGIPLPFISYGGSSLLSFTILLAVLIKLDSQRHVAFR